MNGVLAGRNLKPPNTIFYWFPALVGSLVVDKGSCCDNLSALLEVFHTPNTTRDLVHLLKHSVAMAILFSREIGKFQKKSETGNKTK